jgi:hypothetical protein
LSTRRILAVGLAASLLAAGAAFARPTPVETPLSATPASPGGLRVLINGEPTYFDHVYEGSGTITITGQPGAVTLRKIPLGYALDVVWSAESHVWIDAQIARFEAP